MFKKIFFFLFLFFVIQADANCAEIPSSINSILNSFDFDRDCVVSISVKSSKNTLSVYEKNAYKFLNPASVLKIFTMAAVMNTLGENYSFDTAFYADEKNNLYLKLGADPYLTEENLNALSKSLKQNYSSKINKIYIDDSIIDMQSYPDGWTIDDYWPNSPKISPYMVDFNTVSVDFYLNEDNKNIRIIQKSPYKFSFVNKLIIGSSNSINIINDELHNTVNLEGTISQSVVNKQIPVINPKYFFCKKLNDALNNNGINFNYKFDFAKVPPKSRLVAVFSRPIDEVIKKILSSSNNTAAEMVFKLAGGEYAKKISPLENTFGSFGTTQNGINMFNAYFADLNLDNKQVIIRDGSGVSRYNAMNVNWMTNALLKMNFDYEKFLPTGGQGALSKRMREMEDKVYFKTGTLFGTSSLAGIIKTKEDTYVWASVIMGYNRNKSLIKNIEDEMVYEVFRAGENE